MPNEVIVPLDFQHIFFLLFCKILKYNRPEEGWCEVDVASRKVETRMEETGVWSQGGQVTNLDLLESSRSTWPSLYGI